MTFSSLPLPLVLSLLVQGGSRVVGVSLVYLPYLALSIPSPSSDLLSGSPVWSIQLTGVANSSLFSSVNITFPHVEVSATLNDIPNHTPSLLPWYACTFTLRFI